MPAPCPAHVFVMIDELFAGQKHTDTKREKKYYWLMTCGAGRAETPHHSGYSTVYLKNIKNVLQDYIHLQKLGA